VTRPENAVHSGTFLRVAAAAVALLAALAGCASQTTARALTPTAASATPPRATAPAASSPASAKPSPSPSATAPAKPAARPLAPPDSGARPQTSALPKTSGKAFRNLAHDLWLAVTTGKAKYARPAFFPEKAYGQVKAIANPGSDWQNRLWYDFTLDLAAVHKLIAPGAKLTDVLMPSQYYVWIPAGACYNSVGYWHAPGARVVYRQGGATHSFGVASLISWRGVWYVVHFGAVVRGGASGLVDDPELGPGSVGPPGNC
jgi:hypothetical protein